MLVVLVASSRRSPPATGAAAVISGDDLVSRSRRASVARRASRATRARRHYARRGREKRRALVATPRGSCVAPRAVIARMLGRSRLALLGSSARRKSTRLRDRWTAALSFSGPSLSPRGAPAAGPSSPRRRTPLPLRQSPAWARAIADASASRFRRHPARSPPTRQFERAGSLSRRPIELQDRKAVAFRNVSIHGGRALPHRPPRADLRRARRLLLAPRIERHQHACGNDRVMRAADVARRLRGSALTAATRPIVAMPHVRMSVSSVHWTPRRRRARRQGLEAASWSALVAERDLSAVRRLRGAARRRRSPRFGATPSATTRSCGAETRPRDIPPKQLDTADPAPARKRPPCSNSTWRRRPAVCGSRRARRRNDIGALMRASRTRSRARYLKRRSASRVGRRSSTMRPSCYRPRRRRAAALSCT